MNEKYYLTTAIAYTSGKPHIGNTYEIIMADALARYKRLQGYDVYFQTGTDEHGQKIEEKARNNNQEPQEYVDDIADCIQSIWDIVGTSYDAFVRTSNPSHKEKVRKIFKKLFDQGDLYKGTYEGHYCTPCESFFTESQLIDGKCPDCGREVHLDKEEAYFFKISKYAKRLEEYIENNPHFIEPVERKNEIINNFIKPGLIDLCVSRTSFKWGVQVDFDPSHVVYVWIDALSNYLTFLGYDVDGNHSEEFKKYWPANLQIVGKDILRFHAIYWPIMLMALDLPLPERIFAHPWLLAKDGKMSKSKGDLLYADDLVEKYGKDAIRYYCLHEIPYVSDGIISDNLIIERINSDLANTLGNLVNRTISMIKKYFDGVVISPSIEEELDKNLKEIVLSSKEKVNNKMNDVRVADALDEIFEIFRRSNKYIDETSPWILAKDEEQKERLATVMYNLIEAIRYGTVLLSPFLPDTAENIFNQINTKQITYDTLDKFGYYEVNNHVNEPKPIFMRIDENVK